MQSIDLLSPALPASIGNIQAAATRIRRHSLQMTHAAGLGHPGGDFSAADILATLYLSILRIDPAAPNWPDRDRFILSKGHCSGALYATFAEVGLLPPEALATYMKPLSMLNGHPDRNKVPGVEANTGPLGHGLPIGVGCAKAAKILGRDWRTFVLTGDGELQEGSNWEAAMAGAQFGLDNLTVIVDRNGLQQGARTEATVALEPLADRWKAFGWNVREVNGHDIGALLDVFQSIPFAKGMPNCVIANTIKGRGVSFMENRAEWHHHVPTDAELQAALAELTEAAQ
ncbi:transketolase, N-terminal subunit [Bryobacterales bacterium F-183]|nr:transketolase, N-terminal subunit [Bryobacterales bacterium F-183]